MRITFLGTGTSSGVPAIGCDCATCRSNDPRDQRWRPSIYIELVDGVAVLVDAATDLRAQALRFGISRVDAVLFTHSPADHVLAQKIDGDVRLLAVAQHFDARFASQLLANQVQIRVRRPRRIRRVGDSVPQPARFTRVARADPPRQVTLRSW